MKLTVLAKTDPYSSKYSIYIFLGQLQILRNAQDRNNAHCIAIEQLHVLRCAVPMRILLICKTCVVPHSITRYPCAHSD